MDIFNNTTGSFPSSRMRRNRNAAWVRDIVAETTVNAHDLILPLFVQEGEDLRTEISAMPGVARLSIDLLILKVKKARKLGIRAVALFPVVDAKLKSDKAEEAYNKKNLICRAVEAIKKEVKDIGIICDVALDPYTSHGQDGIVKNGDVDNDATVEILCKQALVLARAGCDIVAPSDMMDGRIAIIRDVLDDKDFQNVGILAYSAKYASSFYGPFREAVGSSINLGKSGKKTYQMNPANAKEAMTEIAMDIEEGADMVMVKPGMPYLDIIKQASSSFNTPVLAYQVSGEYAMIKAAAKNGWLDNDQVLYESILAFKRAGATAVFTYAAIEVAKMLER